MAYADRVRAFILIVVFLTTLYGEKFHTYIGQIESHSVLIAWGTTDGPNTIGRSSVSLGKATVSLKGPEPHVVRVERNWAVVDGLRADTRYSYQVAVGAQTGAGTVRTLPDLTDRLRFFVIGDYGTGTPAQFEIAQAMEAMYKKESGSENPPRFVLTTGDNIYADLNIGVHAIHSGDDDRDWEQKFFRPYAEVLREIPFYPALGNHDGNGSENRGDLTAYLDNFFFPHNQPARWYTFTVGSLAQFFALDSTNNSERGRLRPVFAEDGEEFTWLRKTLTASPAKWKIPYFHHPPFNAGPFHPASYRTLKHFCDAFAAAGVKVVFNGHEHNLQFSEDGEATGGIEYVISGAGGELRAGDVRGKMASAHIAAWAPARHFLDVEIEGATMRITPVGAHSLTVVDADGKPVPMPMAVKLQ